ncbi:hypothetical protein [Candidatus Epulonipiscium viviparus]|uniref:hypothetical protein n=1 Tax=Candidatus Epulonipiscium viviparus TaxID=420336 RepID=UPI0027380656|nr:hypothetical protein [Candidatus Epulopiscium viviparus]
MEILNQVYAQIGDAFTDKVTVTDDITKLDENPLSIIKSSDLTTGDVLVGGSSVTYTIKIEHSNPANAIDVTFNLIDAIPNIFTLADTSDYGITAAIDDIPFAPQVEKGDEVVTKNFTYYTIKAITLLATNHSVVIKIPVTLSGTAPTGLSLTAPTLENAEPSALPEPEPPVAPEPEPPVAPEPPLPPAPPAPTN